MTEDRSALIEGSANSSAIITGERNTANITITNYYYHQNIPIVPIESTNIESENLKCPYCGLFHFSPDDTEFFFGREVFVEELFQITRNHNFIPVLGASGSGKSSVVLAGLVPRLQKEGHWLFTHFRPGADPFHALALALVPLYTTKLNATELIAQARQLAGYFRDNTLPLDDVFAQIQQNHPNYRVLLIADQFEELYTLCGDEKIRRSFLDTLLAAKQTFSSKSQLSHVLVATMRADFLGNVLSYRPLADVVRTDIKLPTMNCFELLQVIEKPALKLGVTFQDGLIKRILDDVDSEPGNLPLLEFALTQLWKHRTGKLLTHTAYEEIGEVSGALARHASENYYKLSATQKEQVRRIFIQLVRPGEGTEDTRRLATKAELGEANWELVKQLADNRLVVTSQNAANQETVEVVHEALISNWGEFRQWVNADRNFRAWQERLRGGMYQWEQTQRDEGALLRGAALAQAQENLKQHQDDLSKGEQEFIRASVELREREKQEKERKQQYELLLERQGRYRLQWLVAVLTAIALSATSFIAYPLILRWLAVARAKTVKIPSGEFVVGTSDPEAEKEEKPQRRTYLPQFEIEKYEVSNNQYRLCIEARVCSLPVKALNKFYDKSRSDHPVVGVTAIQANQYCRWLGRRLPTELEWERAARGSNGRLWPWGNTKLAPEYANVITDDTKNKPFGTEPVTSHSLGRTPEGVYNLVGNVWEWTASYFDGYSDSDGQKHIWDAQGEILTLDKPLALRGGSWKHPMPRITYHTPSVPDNAGEVIGLRCAK